MKISNALCKMGIHKWKEDSLELPYRILLERKCERCGRIEVHEGYSNWTSKWVKVDKSEIEKYANK